MSTETTAPETAPTERPFRPYSGTHGAAVIDAWCTACRHRETCDIVGRTMLHDVDDPAYPREWVYRGDEPTCTAREVGEADAGPSEADLLGALWRAARMLAQQRGAVPLRSLWTVDLGGPWTLRVNGSPEPVGSLPPFHLVVERDALPMILAGPDGATSLGMRAADAAREATKRIEALLAPEVTP